MERPSKTCVSVWRKEGGEKRNFSLKRLAGSNQITLRFRVKQEDLSFGINNGCKTC